MKKLIRGSLARSLSMLLMVLFMLPSLMLPLTTRGHAAVGGHLNILFMPLHPATVDTPQNLSTRILREMQIALAQREGVQVSELLKNSPIMKRALEAVGDENKQDLLDKYNDAANPTLSPDARKNAAGALVRALGVDAIVYGTIDNYEFTTKPDKNRTYIKVTAHKVIVLDDGTAVEIPITAIGTSWVRPDGKGDQVTHDAEAIQAVAQELAKQLADNRGPKPQQEKRPLWNIFGKGSSGGTPTAPPELDDRAKKRTRSGWLLPVLGLALLAAVAGGGGGGDDGGGTVPPPVDDGMGYAYPESDGDIRLEIPKLANWASVAKFEIWRDTVGEARGGRTTVRSKGRSSRALQLVNVTNRDDAVVQNDKVILYDVTAAYGYVYAYRVVIVTTSSTKSNVDIYNGQAPTMQLTAVGPYVPPPVEHVYAPPSLISEGRATLYWFMPGESLVQPPVATYAMPSYVSGFCVQLMDEGTGNWVTVATGIGKNVRSIQVPVPSPNTAYRYTVRAVSNTAGLMYPLEALSTAQQSQVIALVTSSEGYQPAPPQGLSVTAVINTPNPDQINMRLTWTPPNDLQVTGYNIYRRVAGTASVRSSRPITRNLFSSRRSRATGDMELLATVTGRTTTTWTDTSLSGTDYGTAYIYTVTSLAFGGVSESTGIDGQVTVTPVAPPKPTLTLIPNSDDPQAGAYQLQWAVPTDTTVYGYRLWRAESTGSGSLRGPRGITNERSKLPSVLGGRGQRGRLGANLRATRVDASYTMVFETVRRSQHSYLDTNLVADTNYTYVLQYLYLGTTEGGPDSQPVSRVYDVMPGEVTNLQLTYPDGTVYLNWNAPTTNVDGSPLDDPQEFRIYRSTTLPLLTRANPAVDAATLAAEFQLYATVPWGTMDPRSYHDTATFPPRSVTSYVVVPVDAADQMSPGPYEVVQLSLMPPSQQVTITPGLLIARAGDPVQQLVATVLGTDGAPLPDIAVTLTCSPATAGSLSTQQAGTFTQQIEVVTDVSGTAAFYWKPPTDPATAAEIGTITAVITGTSSQYVVYVSIQPPQPTGYQAVSSASLTISQGQPSRIYFSQDVDDLLSDATVTASVLQVIGFTATGSVASYGRIRLNTDRGGFEKMAVDQVVSADRKSIVGVLDENGRMYVRFTGRADNGITDPFIRLPQNNELGNPVVTASDIYTSGTYSVAGQAPQLVGPPYRLAVVQGTTTPATPANWPAQGGQLPVIFQHQITTVEARATDRLGQPVLQGMPIWFTQTWQPFNSELVPYDYNGAFGHGNIAGAYSGPVSLTNAEGIARAGFSSNHSGAYDVRAFALLKTFDITLLNSYNLNSTGGLPATIPTGDALLNNLLWNNGSGPATPERVITEKISLLNKTLAYADHWTVLEVSDGTNSSTTFAEFLDQVPPIIINCDGTQTARITFTATDEDGKKVLPGTPFKVHSILNQRMIRPLEHGFLQLDGDNPSVNRAGTILSFNNRSEAYVLSRGQSEAPQIGTIRLRFDNLRTVKPIYTYPYYLVGHRGPSIWSVPEDSIGVTGPTRLASSDGDCEPSIPKSTEVRATLVDADDNYFPGNYVVRCEGRGMEKTIITAPLEVGSVEITAPDLDLFSTPGYDEVNNVLPRPFMSDVIDTGPTDFSDPDRNLRIIAYGNPWELPREDWPAQYVTVERPHRLTDLYAPSGQTLAFNIINITLNVRVWNNLLERTTVGGGWHIRWQITHTTQDGNATIQPNPSITNHVGIASAVLNTGNRPDIIIITAYYDTDKDGIFDEGYEPSISSSEIYIGLLPVTNLQGTAYQDPVTQENYVVLSWSPVEGATSYEVQQGGTTIGTTTATIFTAHNLNPDTQYTFRVRGRFGAIEANDWVEVTVRTLPAPAVPAVPTGLAALAVTHNSIALDWDDMAGATSYDVQRRDDGGTTWTLVGSPTTSFFLDSGLASSTPYQYQVRSKNAQGSSPWTASLNVTTGPPPGP